MQNYSAGRLFVYKKDERPKRKPKTDNFQTGSKNDTI
jgi:hypothetical protein